MQPGDRSNFGRRRPSGFPSGFPEFPDPFAGFVGMRSGHSLLDDFFNRNPFDDPFFTRPFGSMFGPTGGLFGPSGFFGHSGLFESGGLLGRADGGLLEQRPFNPPQPEGRRGPVIEELPDDHETPENNSRHNQQPIVEHPDDDVGSADTVRQGRNQLRHGQSFQNQSNNGYQSNNDYQTFSFQSSSVSYGGAGGSYYSSSTSRRAGPDGLMEEEHVEKDSTGKEARSTARGLREKVHAITKKRNATGPEETLETLQNLTPEETVGFDTAWEARAERSLPGWNRGRSQMLEGSSSGLTRQSRPALTSNEGSHDGSQPPKKLLKI